MAVSLLPLWEVCENFVVMVWRCAEESCERVRVKEEGRRWGWRLESNRVQSLHESVFVGKILVQVPSYNSLFDLFVPVPNVFRAVQCLQC